MADAKYTVEIFDVLSPTLELISAAAVRGIASGELFSMPQLPPISELVDSVQVDGRFVLMPSQRAIALLEELEAAWPAAASPATSPSS